MSLEVIALIGGAVSLLTVTMNLIVALLTMNRVQKVHLATNSMKDALVETTRLAALAAGRKLGIEEEKARQRREDAPS